MNRAHGAIGPSPHAGTQAHETSTQKTASPHAGTQAASGQPTAATTGTPRRAETPRVAVTLALVGLGGALGTLARAGLAHALPHSPASVPTATLIVNLVGAFALGLLLGRLALSPDTGWRRRVRLAAGTGFMGGLTTYSTFMLEVARLLGADPTVVTGGAAGAGGGHALGASASPVLAVTYWGASLVLGVGLAACGLSIARVLPAPAAAAASEGRAAPHPSATASTTPNSSAGGRR